MTSDLLEPVSPALKDAALLNLGWQPYHRVIDASSAALPPPPDPAPPESYPVGSRRTVATRRLDHLFRTVS